MTPKSDAQSSDGDAFNALLKKSASSRRFITTFSTMMWNRCCGSSRSREARKSVNT